jgi:type I restriction enzyme M protein
MANGIKTRPVRRMTQAELDGFLEKAADILRGNVDHSEFRGYVFALLFFRRISDLYQEEVAALTKKLGDEELARDPKMHNFVVPEGCLWEEVARKNPAQLGTALNEAMLAIERANQPKFDGILTNKIDFNKQDELPRSKLVDLINHFSSQCFDRAHVPEDVFGNAYEYLIRSFASKAGKSSGEFYTPKEVAFLMSEIVEPKPGHHVCDWASGSAGLLLQCRRYVDKHHKGRANELFLYAQESNVATFNISRINMILHGVSPSGWTPKREDSLRQPLHLDASKKLMQFDRIVMNPPFSLKSWGYDDFVGGDPYDRFTFGMPPADQGDYAWMQHVVKSLKSTGKAIIVMSQGILFRGQPEQTEAEDGRNQKADAEYVIRESFVKSDLIECVIVLPSKLFYGNAVPGCLVVLNKRKPEDRKNKILMIWASRHCEETNPQNLLRTSDLMRILVPWRAFGDLEKCRQLIPEHEAALVGEIEAERQAALKDIHDAYDPVLEPLPELKAELARLEAADFDAWVASPNKEDVYFGRLKSLVDEIQKLQGRTLSGDAKRKTKEQLQAAKAELRTQTKAVKDGIKERFAEVKRAVKELAKLDEERTERLAEINAHADRQVAQVKEAAADLTRICTDPQEAKRYFVMADRAEIEENEFNLNLPRYVDTFEPEEEIPLPSAIRELGLARAKSADVHATLSSTLERLGLTNLKTK